MVLRQSHFIGIPKTGTKNLGCIPDFQVHKETIDKVPNSQPSRGNIEIEIYGMEGIPEADLKAHESARGQDDDDEPAAKHAKSDSPAVPTPPLQVICQ